MIRAAEIKIDFDAKGVQARIGRRVQSNQFLLDQQIAKDSNYYCPRDVGSLQDSVIPSAAQGVGVLEWNEVYARAQYYDLPNKSKDKNPNASMKWFEKAKKVFLQKWLEVGRRGFTE
jgi:hypothetical protein